MSGTFRDYSGVCHTDYGFCTNAFKFNPIPTPQGIQRPVQQTQTRTDKNIQVRSAATKESARS